MTLTEHPVASYLASTANTCCQTAAIPQALWMEKKPLPGQILCVIVNNRAVYAIT